MKHPADLHRARRTEFDGRDRHRSFGRHRRSRPGRTELVGMVLVGVAGGLVWAMLPMLDAARPGGPVSGFDVRDVAPPEEDATPAVRATFGFCHSGGGRDCVVDGDTFWMRGAKIRIADIDTPETHPSRCTREADLGAAATRRLQELLNSGAVTLHPIDRDTDRYGRLLRVVSVDGQGVGTTLVAEGLARPYRGGHRAGWCD